MKTEVILHRGLQDFEVMQRSKTGMFNATNLLKQWNSKGRNSDNKKKVAHFFENQKTQEFIETIMEKENLNTPKTVYLKSRGKYNGGTWMHPLLFIDFAMWLNPKFKYEVLRWVSDNLLTFRNDAGDTYKQLTKHVASIGLLDFPKLAKAINYVVYGKHQRDIRNISTESDLKEMNKIQSHIIFSIQSGLITNEHELIESLRRIYRKKYTPKCLQLAS